MGTDAPTFEGSGLETSIAEVLCTHTWLSDWIVDIIPWYDTMDHSAYAMDKHEHSHCDTDTTQKKCDRGAQNRWCGLISNNQQNLGFKSFKRLMYEPRNLLDSRRKSNLFWSSKGFGFKLAAQTEIFSWDQVNVFGKKIEIPR